MIHPNVIAALVAAGATDDMIAAAVKAEALPKTRSPAALRQQRYRDRKCNDKCNESRDVTPNVMRNE
jgi:hypothetical protein